MRTTAKVAVLALVAGSTIPTAGRARADGPPPAEQKSDEAATGAKPPKSIFDFGLEPLPNSDKDGDDKEPAKEPPAAKPPAAPKEPAKATAKMPAKTPAKPAAVSSKPPAEPSRVAGAPAPKPPAADPANLANLSPELREVVSACRVDAQGTITADKTVTLGLKGTEEKHFVVTGELYPAPEPTRYNAGGVLIHLRELDARHRMSAAIDGLVVKRLLFAGEDLKKIAKTMTFQGVAREQWHPFRLEIGPDVLAAQFGDQKADAHGTMATRGRNSITLSPGAKLRNLKVEILDEP